MGIIPKRLKKSGPLVQWGIFLGSMIGLAAVVNHLTEEEKYVPGPHGERKSLKFSQPPFGGVYFGSDISNKRNFTFSEYSYIFTRLESYKNASEASKEYVDRALLNYRWGYTWYDGRRTDWRIHSGSDLLAAEDLDLAMYMVLRHGKRQIGTKASPSIVWPLPKAE